MKALMRIGIYFILLGAGAGWIGVRAAPGGMREGAAAAQTGFVAPDFELVSTSGESYRLSELRGQAVLVNLWATWCPPCRAEMPAIEKMYEEYQGRGLVVLAVNMSRQDEPGKVAPFLEEHGLSFPALLDEEGRVASAYQMRSLPSSYFIDRAGIIREVVIGGPMSEALLRTRIEQILQ